MIARRLTLQEERALISATGNNPRRYVPGSLVVAGRLATWTERCKRRTCDHEGICHAARCSAVPDHARD